MPADINLDIMVPGIRLGPITLSPDKVKLGGVSIRDVLSPLQRAPRSTVTHGGHSYVCYPLRLPNGQGLEIPVLGWTAGFFAEDEGLRLTLPPAMMDELVTRWHAHLVEGPHALGASRTAVFRVDASLQGELPLGEVSLRLQGH